VVLLQHRVEHVREHILLNQSLLLLCRFLLIQRLQLLAAIVLGPLNEIAPDGFLLVKCALVLHEEVVEELDLNQVFLSDKVRVGFRRMRILIFLLIVDALLLLGSLLEVLLLDFDEEFT